MKNIDIDALLSELYVYTLKEQETELTNEESNRYAEIVDILINNNIEIPFGIEV